MEVWGEIIFTTFVVQLLIPFSVVSLTEKPIKKWQGITFFVPIWFLSIVAIVISRITFGTDYYYLILAIYTGLLLIKSNIAARLQIGFGTSKFHAMWTVLGPPIVLIWLVVILLRKTEPNQGVPIQKDSIRPTNETIGEKAQIAIEYRKEVAEDWERIKNLDSVFINDFLNYLDHNPKADTSEFTNQLIEKHEKKKRPFQSTEYNDALMEVRKYGNDAEREFIKIVDTLGEDQNCNVLLKTFKEKYEPKFRNHIQGFYPGV
jgi:hypothetical protein